LDLLSQRKENMSEAAEFKRTLAGTVLKSVATDETVSISDAADWNETVHVGLIHDASGYTPVCAIAVSSLSGQTALETAYAELEEALSDELATTQKELHQDAVNDGLNDDAAWQRAEEWSKEAWDGSVFAMTNHELYDILGADRFGKEWVSQLFDIDDGITARVAASVPDQHQKKICIDTVRNPMKGVILGGPSAAEAEKILKEKFGYSDAAITRLKQGSKVAEAQPINAKLWFVDGNYFLRFKDEADYTQFVTSVIANDRIEAKEVQALTIKLRGIVSE
jgi:hypothetical protein